MQLSGITKKQLGEWFGVYVRKNKVGEIYLTQNGKPIVYFPTEIILLDDSLIAKNAVGEQLVIE